MTSLEPTEDPGAKLLAIYDVALPRVYGYLLSRCGQTMVAEDLTSDAFLAAVDALRRRPMPAVSVAWLMGVARHKLVDHWRNQGREERGLRTVAGSRLEVEDPWDAQLDSMLAQITLRGMAPQHRAALTLRYIDDLPVSQVAALLGRTVHATEGLLVRARAAFRQAYVAQAGRDV